MSDTHEGFTPGRWDALRDDAADLVAAHDHLLAENARLREALEAAQKWIQRMYDDGGGSAWVDNDVRRLIDSALAAVGEGG